MSFKWLGGVEVRPLRVTGKPTGFTGIDVVETSAGFRLVLGFSAAAEWGSEHSIWHTERHGAAT